VHGSGFRHIGFDLLRKRRKLICRVIPTRIRLLLQRQSAMKNMLLQLFLLTASSSLVLAHDLKRFEFRPFGGFTTSGSIPLIGEDDVSHGSIHVDSSYNVGAAFAVHLNSLDSIEGQWQRQFTEGRLPVEISAPKTPGNPPSFNLKIDQIHCNFLHQYRIADPRAMPYVMAGLGATTYYGNDEGRSRSKTHFSFALGGGVKYFLSDHFGFRGEARWSPTLLSSSDSSFWCIVGGSGASCTIKLKTSLQHQLDLTGGVVFRF
jgi:opacity protein-like surface antigen